MSLNLITVNVAAPSVDWARQQPRWLSGRPEEVFVLLTEVANALVERSTA
ncbi:MAG: hypothetical protein ACT4NY_02415 [Pseudonocardiales bacterium]